MSGKVQKHLRRMAKLEASGRPDKEYNVAKLQGHNKRPAHTVVLSNSCVRAVNKRIKKQYADGKAGRITKE